MVILVDQAFPRASNLGPYSSSSWFQTIPPNDLVVPPNIPSLPISLVKVNGVGSVSINPNDAITAATTEKATINNPGVYYVKPSTGSDASAGTINAPFATVGRAMRTAVGAASRIVMLEDCVIPPTDLRNTDASQLAGNGFVNGQLKWLDGNGFNVIVRETVTDLATTTWTQDSTYPNWWKSGAIAGGSQALTRVLRTDTADDEGYSTGLYKATSTPTTNTATPSYFWDAVGKIAWVNLGGLDVQNNRAILKGLWVNSGGTSRVLSIGSSIGFSGIRFEGVQFVSLDGGGRRPEFWLHNCTVLWSVSKSWDGTNAGWFVATNTRFHSSEADHLNAFAPSSVGRGLLLTANCVFTRSGDLNVFISNGTLQGESAHGGSDHMGWGNLYRSANGQLIADTCANNQNDVTWLAGCQFTGGTSPASNLNFGSTATAASRKAYLDTCVSVGAPVSGDLIISSNATVYTRNTALSAITGGSVVPY